MPAPKKMTQKALVELIGDEITVEVDDGGATKGGVLEQYGYLADVGTKGLWLSDGPGDYTLIPWDTIHKIKWNEYVEREAQVKQ